MEENNKVSIVIATYNRASIIGETLDTLIEQTYKNWECIVVDDGSTDETAVVLNEFIKKDVRIKYFSRPSNLPKGPNSSRNFGIYQSSGDYIMSLDSDDFLLADHLEKKIKVFNEDKSIDGVLSKTIMVNDDRKEINRELRTKLTDNLLEDFITLKVSWYMHDILWKKEFLQDKKLYDENLLKWLDRDFHIRRLIERPKIYLLDEYLAEYRIHVNSNSLNSNYKVLETRHKAVEGILDMLKKENLLTNKMKLFFFKFQVSNLVVLYRSPQVFNLYKSIIKKTYYCSFTYLKWVIKLILGYISFKLTGKGLIFVK